MTIQWVIWKSLQFDCLTQFYTFVCFHQNFKITLDLLQIWHCSQPGFRRMVASWTAAAATAGHESIDKVDSSQIMEEQSNQAGLVVWSEDRGQFCKLHMWKVGCLFCLGALKSGRKWLWSELLRTPAADGAVTSQHSAPTSRSHHQARSAVACAWPLFVSAYCLVKRNHSGVETKFVVYFVFLFHH